MWSSRCMSVLTHSSITVVSSPKHFITLKWSQVMFFNEYVLASSRSGTDDSHSLCHF